MIVTKTFEITNENGLHARPSASFVKLANLYKANITVHCNGRSANGKSVLGLMQLAAGKGSKLEVTAESNDARDATMLLHKICELMESGFNEK